MNKRGQFFIIAAIVIAIVVIGIGTVYNYARSPTEDHKVYDLSEELNYESARVIDNGIFNSISDSELGTRLQELSDIYGQSNPDSDIVIVYGNKSEATLLYYKNTETGEISLGMGGSSIDVTVTGKRVTGHQRFIPKKDSVQVTVSDREYDFDLKGGQSFYLIIKKDRGDERIIAA